MKSYLDTTTDKNSKGGTEKFDPTPDIPKEWANQRPRQMASPPAKHQPRPFSPVVGLAFAFCLLVIGVGVSLMFGLATGGLRSQTMRAADNTGNTADKVLITLPTIGTNTPNATATQEPSRTPYPSKTPKAEVVEIVRTIIVEVERIITATGQPTATQTPDIVAEARAEYAAQVALRQAHEVEMQIRNENRLADLQDFFISPEAIVFAVVFVIVGIFGIRINVKWNQRPTEASTTETSEDIEQDRAEKIRERLSIRTAWVRGLNMSQAEELTWPDARTRGGAHYQLVKKYYDEWNQQYGGQPDNQNGNNWRE